MVFLCYNEYDYGNIKTLKPDNTKHDSLGGKTMEKISIYEELQSKTYPYSKIMTHNKATKLPRPNIPVVIQVPS